MVFAKMVWRLLVGIKDALVLLFMLLFFGALYAALSSGPAPKAQVREGALLVKLDGQVVEELPKAQWQQILSGRGVQAQVRERDAVRAIAGAADDAKIKAVVVDLARFRGAGFVHAQAIGAAMDKVRAAKKPVFVYGRMISGNGMLIAAHGSEVWVDPLGGAVVEGFGRQQLYFAALLERLKITAHVFRVGTFKDAVEPYFRDSMSDESRQARKALYDAVWEQWRGDVLKARPKAQVDKVMADPVGWYKAAGGDGAKAALAAGLVDKIGTRAEFGAAVARVVGEDRHDKLAGNFAHVSLDSWLSGHPAEAKGRAIAVVTVAGEIEDGKEGPGVAGGQRIARLIDGITADDYAAIVLRVDSPGGSVNGSEEIRAALVRQKAKGLPVVVSMANVAASGGFWVSTPAARIFAQPGTITGSIGVFAVLPSFEKALANWGVKGDGVRTSPIAGQPDVWTGLTPETEAMLQASTEAVYGRFLGLVSASRGKSAQEIDRIAQGRVWDGGTARQLGLVDQFGGLDDALAYAAQAARLKQGEWHPEWLGSETGALAELAASMQDSGDDADDEDEGRVVDWAGFVAAREQAQAFSAIDQLGRLMQARGVQARCLECVEPQSAPASGHGFWQGLALRLAVWAGIAQQG